MNQTGNNGAARKVAQTFLSVQNLTALDKPAQTGMSVPPWRAIFTAPFLLLIKIYQRAISPALHALAGPNAGCRFYPSCSCYAAEALRAHGVPRGLALAAWRLARCNPFNAGGVDLVPPARDARARAGAGAEWTRDSGLRTPGAGRRTLARSLARPRCERVA